MRKLLFVFLTLLLLGGVAQAASIPQSEDAKNGPYVWTVPVYNNSGSSLAAGSVVVWDVGSSTGDNDNYVTTSSTAGTGLVAGVIYGSACAAADQCTMAIRGVVPVLFANGIGAESSIIGTGTTAGYAGNIYNTTIPGSFLGIVTTAVSGGQVNAMLGK